MVYFDNSATSGVKPESVINAVSASLKHLSANPGRSGHSLALKTGMLVHNTRKKAAELLGVSDLERIIFCLNCTQALNTAILGTVVNGGNVVTTALEHNSVLRPLFELQRMGKITVTVVAPNSKGIIETDAIYKAINGRTYLVAINHVSNVTGAVAPVFEIGKLCKKLGLMFLVDGAQSVGYGDVFVDEYNIDFLAVAPHKGLHAPQGIGILAIGKNAKIKPLIYGGTGTYSESVFQPSGLPESLESGTLPTPSIAGLNAAIVWNNKHRLAGQIKLTEVSAYALERIKSLKNITVYTPENTFNGMVSFNINHLGSMEVCNILSDEYDIATRGGLHCAPLVHKHLGTLNQGIVRASLSFENTFAEVHSFIKAISEISN